MTVEEKISRCSDFGIVTKLFEDRLFGPQGLTLAETIKDVDKYLLSNKI